MTLSNLLEDFRAAVQQVTAYTERQGQWWVRRLTPGQSVIMPTQSEEIVLISGTVQVFINKKVPAILNSGESIVTEPGDVVVKATPETGAEFKYRAI